MTKPKTPNTTLVTFLLDRSGSMSMIRDATIESFNAYIDGLKAGKGIVFSLLQFDSMSIDTTCKNVAIADAPHLSYDNFQPRAGTPLIDACMKTIRAVETAVAKRDDNPQVVICFQTDGQENESREHTWPELSDLIKKKTKLGWQFNFMGAGIDAYAQASKMGLGAVNTMSYDSTSLKSTRSAFAGRASATVAYAATGNARTMNISDAEKMSAGDRFNPTVTAKPKPAPKIEKVIVDEPEL